MIRRRTAVRNTPRPHRRPPASIRGPSARALAALGFACLACLLGAGCRRSAPPPPERFVAGDAHQVFVIPELRRAARELASLQELAAAFPPAEALAQQRGPLAAQLGFDPLDPDALAEAGIDPSRGLAVAVGAGGLASAGDVVLIVPLRDERALEQRVTRLARERLGATERTETTQGDVRVITFTHPTGGATYSLGLRARDRTAALALGAKAVRAALSLAPARSLAAGEQGAAKQWRALRQALGDRFAMIAAQLAPGLGPRIAAGASADPAGVRLGVAVALPEDATAVRALGARGDARALVPRLSSDAPLVLRWDGDPAALGRLLVPRVPAPDRQWLADHGFDLQRDLFDLLAPGVAASVSLSPRFDLSDFSDVALRADPLRIVEFEMIGDVKDEAAAGRSLARLPVLIAALEAPVGRPRPATVDAAGRTGRIGMASGELAWRLDGRRLLVAGGRPGALEALARRKAGWTAPSLGAAAALTGGLGGGVLAPRTLVRSVRQLPEDAFGTGPFGFVVRGIVDRYLELLEGVEAVSVRSELGDAALLVDVRAEVSAGGRRPGHEARP